MWAKILSFDLLLNPPLHSTYPELPPPLLWSPPVALDCTRRTAVHPRRRREVENLLGWTSCRSWQRGDRRVRGDQAQLAHARRGEKQQLWSAPGAS